MADADSTFLFKARLQRPANTDEGQVPAFVVLPAAVSAKLPRRGRTTVVGTINGHPLQVMLEPDGQLGHWLPISAALLEATGARVGATASFRLRPADREPEPELPADFAQALSAATGARAVWDATTTLARVDWIHWIESARKPQTRDKRIRDACEMLARGKKRVCCFDPSGHYSKAFAAPLPDDGT
jgi:hypothetical protein